MNWKKIERLCRAAKQIVVQNTPDGPWIGDNTSLYPMYGLPELSQEAVLTLFGVKPTDWDGYHYRADCVSGINLGDADDGEREIVPIGPVMCIGGAEIIAFPTRECISFLDLDHLKPVGDDAVGYYERLDASGRVYIAVKKGFELKGVIYPNVMPMIHRNLPNELATIASRMRQRAEQETEEDPNHEQMG